MDVARDASVTARKLRRRLAVGTLLVVAFGAVSYGAWQHASAPSVDRSNLVISEVRRGDLSIDVQATGVLLAKDSRWIAAETAGRVDRVLIAPGSKVDASVTILVLSNPGLRDQLLSGESALEVETAERSAKEAVLYNQLTDQRVVISSLRSEYALALSKEHAQSQLIQSGMVAELEYEQTKARIEQLNIRIQAEEERNERLRQSIGTQLSAYTARIRQLASTVELRRAQVAALNVKAGMLGLLQQVVVEEGQQVTAGTNLARVADATQLFARLRVVETDAKDVSVGQLVRIDTHQGLVEGRVERVSPIVQNGVVQVDVALDTAPPPGVRVDLSIDGTTRVAEMKNVLYVRRPAGVHPHSTHEVFVVTNDSVAHLRRAEFGRASSSYIEVLDGLRAGDQIVVSDVSDLPRAGTLRLN